MNYAQSLLETVFGGLRPAARALNKPASTIQSWQESGTIPQKHWAEIIRKSAALGHDLTVEDFIDDDLFTAEPTPKGDNQDGHKGDINPTSNPKIPPKTANEMLNFAGYDFNKLHCLTIADFHRVDIETLLQLGSHYLDLSVQKSPRKGPLKGKTLINLFFENSTRTEKSFELAGKRLGADVISMQVASSSVKKGETLLDTASTLNAMNPDLLVVRHSASGAPALLAQKLSCGVINAGDGLHAHPTQALLDALTLRETLKAQGKGDIGGLRIAICGDILHSRVARSNVQLFNMLGAQIHLIAPPTLMPLGAQNWGVNIFHTMKEGLEGCDIIMMLRMQLERMHGAFVPSKREYFHYHGLTRDKLAYANKDVLVMHPGPMNRGVEISSDIADDPQISLITRQVEAGVAMRMAILHALSNAQDRNKNPHISGKG